MLLKHLYYYFKKWGTFLPVGGKINNVQWTYNEPSTNEDDQLNEGINIQGRSWRDKRHICGRCTTPVIAHICCTGLLNKIVKY